MGFFKKNWVFTKKILVGTLAIAIIVLSIINISIYKLDSKKNEPQKEVAVNDKKSLTIVNEESEVINYDNIKKTVENQKTQTEQNIPEPTPKINKSGEYKDIFNDDLFIGDSITKALVTYKFIPSHNVCAKIGIGNDRLIGYLDNVEKSDPEKIFLLCGVNDLDGSLDRESFRRSYDKLIQAVKTKFPKSTIYVQSILPLSPNGEEKPPYIKNSHIEECNKIIMDIAQKQGITYLNISQVINSNSVYEEDGLHFKSNFYPLWLKYLIDNVK